jgi:hypothetical protein
MAFAADPLYGLGACSPIFSEAFQARGGPKRVSTVKKSHRSAGPSLLRGCIPSLSQPIRAYDNGGDGFAPTVANRGTVPGPSSKGMVRISGGEFSMGAKVSADMNMIGMLETRAYAEGNANQE